MYLFYLENHINAEGKLVVCGLVLTKVNNCVKKLHFIVRHIMFKHLVNTCL